MSTASVAPTLEAVYYGSPIPANLASLTLLAIVFDRLYFPHVRLPTDGYDLDAVLAEAKRIEGLGRNDYETAVLVGALRTLPHLESLNEFCSFTGAADQVFGAGVDPQTGPLVKAIEELVFGPPPPGFFPTYTSANSKGLPGGEESIDYPGTFFYPATALQFAAKSGLPLVNDNPAIPVPGLGGMDAKNNAKVLASILAMECVNFALPAVRPLSPAAIVELRAELRPYLQPFRSSVLKLAKELNNAIASGDDYEQIVKAARFLVQVEVEPTLSELKAQLGKPTRGWLTRSFDLVKQIPQLATTFATMPREIFYAQALAAVGGLATDLNDKRAAGAAARSGLYYLLRLQRANDRRR